MSIYSFNTPEHLSKLTRMQFVFRGQSSNTQVAEILGFVEWRGQTVLYTETKYTDHSPPLEVDRCIIK